MAWSHETDGRMELPDEAPVRDDLPVALTCITCDGEGEVPVTAEGPEWVPCPTCDGTGEEVA